ncbi:hypothetical protein P4B35_12385 [Pontiellaceae bacterium B12227]|nr:hypothetical protein [Pontiellaceae bacterium B12227]
MRKQTLSLMLTAGFAWAAQGQLFDSGAGSYTPGDLAGQANWTQLLNYDTNGVPVVSNQLSGVTFSVDNSSWVANDAASDTAFLMETNASYVYLDEPSAGNELYSEWTGTMDFNFSIPAGTYAAGSLPNANFFAIGLTSSTTNGLSQFDQNDVVMFLRYRANNRLDMQLQTEADADLRIFQTPSDATTYAEPAVLLGMNPQTGDCQSDELRLSWTIRKSTDGVYSGWGSVSNLSTGVWIDDIRTNGLGGKVVSTAGKDKSAAVYASSAPQLAMGRHTAAWATQYAVNGNGLLDIDINDLTVVKSIVSPALTAPENLGAVAYDSQVTVSWETVPDADSYDVFRATSSGGYTTAFTNVTELSVVDEGLANDTEYFYVVQSVFPGFSNSTNSLEVSATPVAIFNGSVIDHGFTTTDGYANGDLAGQLGSSGWKAAAYTTANAFNIINAAPADGQASTMGNGFINETNLSNAVYLDRLMDNEEDDTWEGSIDFQVQAYTAPGSSVATLLNADIFTLGVTRPESQDDAHNLYSGNQALMSLRLVADGNLAILFSTENSTADTRLAQLQRENVGWDPEDEEADGVSVADLITDTITLDWSIRKTRDDDVYQATATLTSSGATAPAATNASLAFTTDTLENLYASPSVKFTMGQYKNAWKTNGTLTNKADVVLHNLSLAVTDSLPVASAPTGVATVGGDRSVMVSWDATLEANSYDLLMAETAAGSQVLVANVVDATVLDTPRFNGVTSYYTVRANFDTGTADSIEVPGTPEALIAQVDIDGFGSDSTLISGSINMDQTTGLQTNVANSVTYIDYSSTAFVSTARYSNWNGPTMYGLSQVNSIEPDITSAKGTTGYRIRQGGTQVINGTQSDHFEFTTAGTVGQALWYVKSTDFAEPKASIDLTVDTHTVTIANQIIQPETKKQRVAIRNNGTWYVSETFLGDGRNELPDATTIANLYDDNWAVLAVIPGTLMVDPVSFDSSNNDSFTQVDAIGFFCEGITKWKPYQLIYNTSGSIPSTEYWMNQYAGVSNLTENTDGDALSNLKEYAFGGNPEDPNDVGTLPEFTRANYMGTDGFIVTHVELRDPEPGIGYSLETSDNLTFVDNWDIDAGMETIGTNYVDYYTVEYTNFIPVDIAAKFIDLKVNQL